MKKKFFCTVCQIESDHTFTVVKNNDSHEELLATCDCGHFVKFPVDVTKEELATLLSNHALHNVGQVPSDDGPIPTDHPVLKHLAEI